jgi:LmbE family N-acetylglucosaminyl deacetylase
MTTHELPPLPSCDSLYISPHADDVLLSCPGRLLAETQSGARVLVVTLFGDGAPSPALAALGSASIEHRDLRLPGARRRSPEYASFLALAQARFAADEEALRDASALLNDLAHRTKAKEVYLPLGVGSHIDHRLAHEASVSAFQSGDGRNVFLYEERPEALVRGAVRVRLGQLGARLPPAAAHAAEPPPFGGYLWRFHLPPLLRGDLRGWPERIRSTGLAARQWRQGRAWHPHKGFGPRLQPVVQEADGAGLEALRALQKALGAAAASPRVTRLAAAYTRRLGAKTHAERYWLLLPPREEGGVTTVAAYEDGRVAASEP